MRDRVHLNLSLWILQHDLAAFVMLGTTVGLLLGTTIGRRRA